VQLEAAFAVARDEVLDERVVVRAGPRVWRRVEQAGSAVARRDVVRDQVVVYTPANLGCGCPAFGPVMATAGGSWLGRVIPQSNRLSVLVLNSITLCAAGPTDVGLSPPSETRIPPTLFATRLPMTRE